MYAYNLGIYFSKIASDRADSPALRYRDRLHSYGDLLHCATRLAKLLQNKGCRRGDVIAIGHNKHPLSYALMLAGLRMGVPYVNIDTASPVERNTRILNASEARLLFYDAPEYAESIAELASASDCEAVLLDDALLPDVSEQEATEQECMMEQVDGACIAYIMFTSGSTGIPKGVAVTHQNVTHLIAWGQDRFSITGSDIFANLSPMYFDNSVFDFYVGLFSGASLAPIARELLTAPYDLVAYVRDMQCTIWFSVPTLLIYLTTMKALGIGALPVARSFVFGGEGYPKTELKKLYDAFTDQAELINVYGPTECTCICSAHTVTDSDFEEMEGLPMLGHLNPNFDYRILDEQKVDSDAGELCLIGPNVAAGYYNDERTSEAFETLRDTRRYGKRMYRTGDLVREVDGQLYFQGRKDNQIKHMGYRIELEEIEAAVHALPGVVQAAVVYNRVNAAFGKIYCYVQADSNFNEDRAMAELAQKLPEYMLPNKISLMNELPRNPNGKVDRRSLLEL